LWKWKDGKCPSACKRQIAKSATESAVKQSIYHPAVMRFYLVCVSSDRGESRERSLTIPRQLWYRPTTITLQPCKGRRSAIDRWGATRGRNRRRLRPSDPSWFWPVPGWWTVRSCLCARRWPKQKPTAHNNNNNIIIYLFGNICMYAHIIIIIIIIMRPRWSWHLQDDDDENASPR